MVPFLLSTKLTFATDLSVSTAFEWPSLTVEWFPEKEVLDKGLSRQKLLLGTHTANDEQNYVLIAEILLPLQDSELQLKGDTDLDEVPFPQFVHFANSISDEWFRFRNRTFPSYPANQP